MQLFNCATWSLFPEQNFRRWAKLTLIFLLISFALNIKLDFEFVVPLVPITFCFIIPLTCCHRRSVTSSRNLSTNVIINILRSSKISIEILMRNSILCPWWSVLSSTTLLPSHQHKLVRVWCYTSSSLLSSNCSSLPWNINISYVLKVVRITPPLMNYWCKWCFSQSPIFSWPPVFQPEYQQMVCDV